MPGLRPRLPSGSALGGRVDAARPRPLQRGALSPRGGLARKRGAAAAWAIALNIIIFVTSARKPKANNVYGATVY